MPELWDLYDIDRQPLSRTIQRGEALPEGTYHLAVFNTKGDILLTQRAQEKSQYPGCWEIPGGCAQAGETSLEAACRELREETGIVVQPGELLPGAHLDMFAVTKDVPLSQLALQPGKPLPPSGSPLGNGWAG